MATKKTTTTSKNGTQPKRGRGQPKSQKYDKELFEDLCKIQCTEREICQLFHTADSTLRAWIGETYQDKDGNPRTWDDVYGEYSAGGKMSLRRSQFRLAEKNAQMAIFLGKQYLGQTEKTEMKVAQFAPDIVSAVERVATGRGYAQIRDKDKK